MAVMKSQANQRPLTEAEEIEAMLPWLVTGKLTLAETARVTRYLETHPEAAAHVALARDEQHATVSGNEVIAAPSTAALDRLMTTIARTPQPRHLSVPSPASVWDKIAGFVSSLSPKSLGIAAAAAAIALVVQAAAIGVLMTRDGGGYETASGPPAGTGESVYALVTLQPGIAASALTAALRDLGGAIVEGPRSDGHYRLRVAGKAADAPVVIGKIKARGDVFATVLLGKP
jgi:anti-sigma factor RsiW